MVTRRVGGIRGEQVHKRALGENVVAHGGVDQGRVARDGRRIGVLFVKGQDASVLIGLNDPELGGVLLGRGDGGHGYFRVPGHVEFDHVGDVHAVDVIGAKDGHHVRVGLLNEVNVLQNSVSSALVPGFIL